MPGNEGIDWELGRDYKRGMKRLLWVMFKVIILIFMMFLGEYTYGNLPNCKFNYT